MGIRKDLVGASLTVTLWAAISKISGLVRDMLVAFFLGTTGAADTLYLAFQIPNLFRRFYGDGTFSSVLVPELARINGKEKQNAFLSRVFLVMGIAGATAAFFALAFARPLVAGLFPGTMQNMNTLARVALLLRIMSAYLVFASLAMVLRGMFESAKIFSISAATFFLFNLTIIVFLLFFQSFFPDPAITFSVGVAVGGAIQFLTHLAFLRRIHFKFSLRKERGPDIRPLFRRALPVVLSMGIFQVNMLVGRGAASFLKTGEVSSLDYAGRIIEIVMGLAILPVATVLLPAVSRLAATSDRKKAETLTEFSMKLAILTTIPATVGLCMLSRPISALLFQRGKFNAVSTGLTANALFFFATGLLFFGLFKILAQVSLSFHNPRLPFRAAILAFTVNLLLCIFLSEPMGNSGIALSATLGAMAGTAVLAGGIGQHLRILWGKLAGTLVKTGIASGIMAGEILLLRTVFTGKLAVLPVIALAISSYVLAISLLMMGEWKKIRNQKEETG